MHGTRIDAWKKMVYNPNISYPHYMYVSSISTSISKSGIESFSHTTHTKNNWTDQTPNTFVIDSHLYVVVKSQKHFNSYRKSILHLPRTINKQVDIINKRFLPTRLKIRLARCLQWHFSSFSVFHPVVMGLLYFRYFVKKLNLDNRLNSIVNFFFSNRFFLAEVFFSCNTFLQ